MDSTNLSLERITVTHRRLSRKLAGWIALSAETTRKGVITLADQAVVSGTNFLSGAIIGRACVKEEFGLYMLAFSIALIVVRLQASLISAPYTVYIPRLTGSANTKYTGSTLIHQLALSALTILVLAVAGVVLSVTMVHPDLESVMWTLVVVITFIMLREYSRRICFAGMRMKSVFVLDSSISVAQIGGLLLLAHIGALSASSAYWVVGAACGIATLGWLVRNRKAFTPRATRVYPDLKCNLSFGQWNLAASMSFLMSHQLYPWFLAAFHGTAATGVFAACWGVVALLNPLLLGVGNFLGPKAAHAHVLGVVELRQVVFKATMFLAGITGLFCLAIYVFGAELVVRVYGSQYADNGLIVSLLALGVFARILTTPISYGFCAMKRPDLNLKASLIALGVTLTLGLWLAKSLASIGAAFGLLACTTMASIVMYITFRRLVRNVQRTI